MPRPRGGEAVGSGPYSPEDKLIGRIDRHSKAHPQSGGDSELSVAQRTAEVERVRQQLAAERAARRAEPMQKPPSALEAGRLHSAGFHPVKRGK